jgi:membrane protein
LGNAVSVNWLPGTWPALARRSSTVWRDAVGALWHGFVRFYNSNDLTHASSIAYFSLLSLFPGVMLMLALLGHLTASEEERTAVVSFFLRYFPTRFGFLAGQLDALRGQHVTLGLAGGLLTAWAALGVFGAITTAMNSAWKVERQPSYLRHKLVSSLMMLAAGIMTFVGLLVVSAQNVIGATWFHAVVMNTPALTAMTGFVANWATLMLFVLVTGLIFYFVPNTHVRFRDVWLGALLSGVLWRLALAGFSWYVRDLSRFSIHGSLSAVVVFLIWVYLWAVILMYGAEYTVAYAQLRARRLAENGPDT